MVPLMLCALFLPPAPETELKRFQFTEPHMGTRFTITLYAPDEATATKASKAAFARCAQLNGIMSDYLPTSELMQLCQKAADSPVKVSPELFTVLARAHQLSQQSAGAFDITVGPAVHLWRRARKTLRFPDDEALKTARALIGWKNLHLDPKTRTVGLDKAGMRLDLGGIAKGYAADQMLLCLQAHGIRRALIAAGGDVRLGDAPPGKKGWTIAIAPVSDKEKPDSLVLANAAVSTSGDAEQFVLFAGKRYSHIVDPRTGIGLIGRRSATVIAPDGLTADSLATTLAVLGPKQGFPVVQRYKATHARYVLKTDTAVEVSRTPDFPR